MRVAADEATAKRLASILAETFDSEAVSQAFNSDVGVENDPIQFNGGYVWYDVLGITPSRERNLDEVKDQVEARWREDQISTKLRAKATEIVQKLENGGKLADIAASLGVKVETAADSVAMRRCRTCLQP